MEGGIWAKLAVFNCKLLKAEGRAVDATRLDSSKTFDNCSSACCQINSEQLSCQHRHMDKAQAAQEWHTGCLSARSCPGHTTRDLSKPGIVRAKEGRTPGWTELPCCPRRTRAGEHPGKSQQICGSCHAPTGWGAAPEPACSALGCSNPLRLRGTGQSSPAGPAMGRDAGLAGSGTPRQHQVLTPSSGSAHPDTAPCRGQTEPHTPHTRGLWGPATHTLLCPPCLFYLYFSNLLITIF